MPQSPEATPPPQQQRGIFTDILDRIFSYADRPWRAAVIILVVILGAIGWGGWLSQDALVDVWKMSSGSPVLKRSELPEILKHLRDETNADIVGLWSLKLGANAMNFEKGYTQYGKDWEFIPRRLPAIRDPVSSPRGLSEIMAGQIICRTVQESEGEDLFHRRMVADKIKRLCIIPVPPAPNVLVGMLLVAWMSIPDKSSEEAALGLARETASTMVSKWE